MSIYSEAIAIDARKETNIKVIQAAIIEAKHDKAEAEKMLARSPITSAIRRSEMADKALVLLYKRFDAATA